jgi:hypothetical protein
MFRAEQRLHPFVFGEPKGMVLRLDEPRGSGLAGARQSDCQE